MEAKCTLSNEDLINKSFAWVKKLAETGGNAWTLRVPVDFNSDPDILFCELGNRLKEFDLINNGLNEGAENWKAEYDNCRKLLQELVALKELKDLEGKTESYLTRQPLAWRDAKEFLTNYQHESW